MSYVVMYTHERFYSYIFRESKRNTHEAPCLSEQCPSGTFSITNLSGVEQVFLPVSFFCAFYPTGLKGCHGIIFTRGVRMGGGWSGRQASGGKKFVQAVSQKVYGVGS